jgi:transglutaminase-like putative cysteine protease
MVPKLRLPLLLLCLVVSLSAVAAERDEFRPATPEELALKDVPYSPGAPAVVLDWYVRHDDVDSRAIEYTRIKVLTEEGKKYGDIELFSIPQYHQVRAIKARTIAPDGKATEFNGKIYDKIVVKRGGLKVSNKTFTLPNVVPGTIIEYRYMVEWPMSQLRTNRWPLQRDIPIQRASFWIRPWADGLSSLCSTRGLPPSQTPRRVKDHFEFEIDNMPAFQSEPFTPPEAELKPRIEFFYTNGKVDEYWEETAKEYNDYIDRFIGDRRGIKEAAAQLTAGATTSEEKLRKLYTRVQEIRNLSYEPDKTEQEEKRAKLKDNDHIEQLWKNGYGYSRELNRLFAGLARAAGFPAQIVLVSDRDEVLFSKHLPDDDQFSSEIVVVNVDGKDRYFDPGTPYLPFGMLSWENTLVPGMRLKGKRQYEWVMMPDQTVDHARVQRAAELRLEDGVVKGTATITYRGQEAVSRRIRAMNEDEAANKKSFEDGMKELLPEGSTVKVIKIENLTGPATLADEPVIASYDVELPNLGTFAGSRALIPVSVFESASKNPFASEQRKFQMNFSYQREVEDTIKLQLPTGYSVESLPKQVFADLGAFAFAMNYAKTDKEVTLSRKMTTRVVAVSPEHYPTLRKFYGARTAADHDTVVLKKASGS